MNDSKQFQQRIALFSDRAHLDLLCCNLRGIERETLRVDGGGKISHQPHPQALGAALTHPWITTDYSEALLEFITDPSPKVGQVLEQLRATHQFTARNLPEGELLWSNSMPGILGADDDIPVAQYGTSNTGQMKTIYRLGLGLRYGRKMQTISGVHFNFSVPGAVWSLLRRQDNSLLSLQEYKTEGYFGLIRNFRRWFWLLLYNMGASPLACKCFLEGRPHQLEPFPADNNYYYLPYATSLRMGDLGYQSAAQDALYVCYNDVNSYISSLRSALLEPYEAYGERGEFDASGHRHQLSDAVLQIENEFYSTVRPKQTARSGETQLKALLERGVEYVEVRCVDINPFDPLGIDETQINFIEVFLLTCLFEDSPNTDETEYERILRNQKTVVSRGREPDLELESGQGLRKMQDWASEILEKMTIVAEQMDQLVDDQRYTSAVDQSKAMLENPELTPSARLINELNQSGKGFLEWTIDQSRRFHKELVAADMSLETREFFERSASDSLSQQAKLEAESSDPLESYLSDYFDQYRSLKI